MSDDFAGLDMLTSLDASNNMLESLPDGFFSGLTALTEADFSGNSVDPLTLTLTLETTEVQNEFVAELVQGAPINIVAIVTIMNGTFSDNTMSANTVIQKGRTQSAPITVTPPAPGTSPTLMVTTPTSLGSSYSGLAIEATTQSFRLGICDRTPQVRDAILVGLSMNDCAQVTLSQLTGITTLDLSDPTPNDASADTNGDTISDDMDDITSLRSEDFEDLTSLTTLDLGDNQLMQLPAGIFVDLTNLTELVLNGNQLTASLLSAGIFSDLTNLTTLDLGENQLTFSCLQEYSTINGVFRTTVLPA